MKNTPKKSDSATPTMLTNILTELADLSPAYFGMVMATGIVSLAAYLLDMHLIARALLLLNMVVYAVLVLLNLLRMLRYPRRFFGDMIDHLRGPGFFAVVAATGILAAQFVLLKANYRAGTALWVVALLLWIGLTYTIFAGFTVKQKKPTLDKGISGAWLLAVVATQSIAVLSALLSVHVSQPIKLEMNFLALSMWLWGGMLYIWMMSLIFYRYTFFPLSPGDLSPPYWINMGAMAISTLAGALLLQQVGAWSVVQSIEPFVKGVTLLFWVSGSWWIPLLLVLGVWRHGLQHHPLRYEGLYWAMVFPLGMYAMATHHLALVFDQSWLQPLAQVFTWVALGAWILAALGLIGVLARALLSRTGH